MSINVTPIPRLTTFGTPGFTLGITNSGGDSQIAVASNSTLLAYDTTLPATISTAGATGSATTSARRDHVHAGSLQSKVIQFSRTSSAGAGDQAITGAGFTPTTIQVLGVVNDLALANWGWGDSDLDERAIVQKGATPVFAYIDDALISLGTSPHQMRAVLKSLDVDGCTLTWTEAGSGTDTYNFVLFLR